MLILSSIAKTTKINMQVTEVTPWEKSKEKRCLPQLSSSEEAFWTCSLSHPLMTASSLLNLLLIFATFAFCHADILASTSSFFTICTDTCSSRAPPPPPLTPWDVDDGTGSCKGWLSGTIAKGFVSSIKSSSLILPQQAVTIAVVVVVVFVHGTYVVVVVVDAGPCENQSAELSAHAEVVAGRGATFWSYGQRAWPVGMMHCLPGSSTWRRRG